jgi:hypothetical protein
MTDTSKQALEAMIERLETAYSDPRIFSTTSESAALLRALLGEREWRPIDTAPRDGTPFIGYGSYLYQGDAHVTSYTKIVEYSGDEDWPWLDDDSKNKLDSYSHWRTLPSPPETEGKA